MAWLPKHYFKPVQLHGVTAACDETGERGISFRLPDGEILRVRVTPEVAHRLAFALTFWPDYPPGYDPATGSQASISPGSPSSDASPSAGQAV